MTYKGKGKIARLPFELRQELNLKLRDGVPRHVILAWLNLKPEVAAALADAQFGGRRRARRQISAANLSEYCRDNGPYERWEREQENVDRVKTLSEYCVRMAEAAGGNVGERGVAIAAGKLLEVLETATSADAERLSKALSGLSEAESKALRARSDRERLAVQRQALDLERQKFRYAVARDALALFEDQAARAIAEGAGGREEKIQRLLEFMESKEKAGLPT